jgi:hypothetical protein
VYLAAWIAIAYGVPMIALRSTVDPTRALLFIVSLSVVAAGLRKWRASRARQVRDLVFDEVEPTLTTTLDLTSSRA